MDKFKIGDVVEDVRRSAGHEYKYGIITEINGNEIYCWWSDYLENLKSKIYTSKRTLWCDVSNLKLVEPAQPKKIKPYPISDFMDSLNGGKLK
jgi:hypothetical protein